MLACRESQQAIALCSTSLGKICMREIKRHEVSTCPTPRERRGVPSRCWTLFDSRAGCSERYVCARVLAIKWKFETFIEPGFAAELLRRAEMGNERPTLAAARMQQQLLFCGRSLQQAVYSHPGMVVTAATTQGLPDFRHARPPRNEASTRVTANS